MNKSERIVVRSHGDGNWNWTYYGPKGAEQCASKMYTSKTGCLTGLLVARKGLATAKAELHYNSIVRPKGVDDGIEIPVKTPRMSKKTARHLPVELEDDENQA